MLRNNVRAAVAWSASLLLIVFSVYSMQKQRPDAANTMILLLGMFQCVALLKWNGIAFKMVGVELFLAIFLIWGIFFPLADSERNIDVSFEVSVGLFFLSVVVLLVLSGLCLSVNTIQGQIQKKGPG